MAGEDEREHGRSDVAKRKPRRQRRVQGGREKPIGVRFTKEDAALIAQIAEEAGMSEAALVAEAALAHLKGDRGGPGLNVVERRRVVEEVSPLYRQLARSRDLLNQLAAAANSGTVVDEGRLAATLEYHRGVLAGAAGFLSWVDPQWHQRISGRWRT